jgi:hypothetical protein
MPTKFVVLWLQTVFITNINDCIAAKQDLGETIETVLQSENTNSLEDALRFYNQKVSDPVNAQVMILVPLKEFNRSIK